MKRSPKSSRRARGLAAAAAIAALLLPCGCEELIFGSKPKGVVSLGNKRLLVLPFATPNRKPFESEIGKTFSRVVAQLVRDGCPLARVFDADDVPASIEGQDTEQVPLAGLGHALGVQYIAVGEIHELRAKVPGSYKVLQGTMVLSARVVDVADGAVVWQFARRKFYYPRPIAGEMIPAETDDEEEVIRSVMKEGAWAVAAVFRGSRSNEDIRLDR